MILILGLDGATLDLVEPWVADGTLPNLGRLMRQGAYGRLASTVPPATFPSWTSFMTGVNPGRHGVFDFTRREPGAYRVRFVNATFRRTPSIWRLLSGAGKRVCVLGLPGTYPPEPINGCMVSGFDTPVTTRADASFVYPADLISEVERCGGFPFADFQEFSVGDGWHARALDSMLESIRKKARLATHLLQRESWDCFMLLFGESDTVGHHFWAAHDKDSPRARVAPQHGSKDGIRRVYVALDAAVGELCRQVPSAHVLVVSDHGFGGAGTTALFINRWLAEQGFLSWSPRRPEARLLRAVRDAAVRLIPEQWQAACFRFGSGRLANAVESGVRFGGIDWANTRAFSEELNYFPSLWLNVRGRDAAGTVAAEDYDQVCAELAERLLAWRDPINGNRVVRQVWRRDEIYRGPYVAEAPDLILDLETPSGYSYVCLPSGGLGETVRALDAAELAGGKLRGMSGSHRPDGLFVLAGEGVAAGEMRGCWIGDMAPTILKLCGLEPPSDWDGRPVSGLRATGESLVAEGLTERAERPYDAGEEECIRERLEQLGYLD